MDHSLNFYVRREGSLETNGLHYTHIKYKTRMDYTSVIKTRVTEERFTVTLNTLNVSSYLNPVLFNKLLFVLIY